METRLYLKCCRLCLDDTKEQIEVCTDDRLTATLLQLYNVKVEETDVCTKKICVECFREANETQKWLKIYEEQKKLIAENQQKFNEELINQLGPAAPSPAPSSKSARSIRATRQSPHHHRDHNHHHRTDDDEEEERGEKDEDFIPQKSPRRIKKEKVRTRRSIKKEWLPGSEGSGRSSTVTEHASDDEEEDDASETGTSTTDDDLKCPKCEKVFREIDQLERHSCEFLCSICSASLKYRHSLKRHLVAVHKIKSNQWQEYWNPVGDNPAELLVETKKPKKRYRYESDSPTDIEEDSNMSDDGNEPKDLVCSRCGDKFDTSLDLKTHDCDYMCNICGVTFASRTNVKRHKIRVHKIDPDDPSLVSQRSRANSRAGSRPPSRPPSRAFSEHPSDDEPLATLAVKDPVPDPEYSEDAKTRFFCPDCDYSNYKRYKITQHLLQVHRTPKEQIDVEAIPKKLVAANSFPRSRSKTPVANAVPMAQPAKIPDPIAHRAKTPSKFVPIAPRPKTPTNFEPVAERSKTPTKFEPTTPPQKALTARSPTTGRFVSHSSKTPTNYEPVPYRSKTPDPSRIYGPPSTQPAFHQPATSNFDLQSVAQPFASQHRSRSRSIHQDSRNGNSKRKRSLSSSSSKSARFVRARSNPPLDNRNILVAKRRLSPSRALAQVSEKLRPTVSGIEANRLFVSIRQSCEDFPPSQQQIRIRATSHIAPDPCPTKRLFKLKPPMGPERKLAQSLRGVFSSLSHRISSHSKVNTIDVDSLVLDLIHPPNPEEEAHDEHTSNDTEMEVDPHDEVATFEIREVGSDEATQVVVSTDGVNVLEPESSSNSADDPLAKVADGDAQNGETAVTPVDGDHGDKEETVAVVVVPEETEPSQQPAAETEEQDEHDGEDVSIVPD